MPKRPNSSAPKKGPNGAKIAVEILPITRLVPYANNARTHPPEQVAQIAASIKQFGFNVPVLVDAEGVLIAGHGRVLGAQELGLKSVPAIRIEHLSDAQVRAFRLADNKIALNADWLTDLLRDELVALDELGIDRSLTGFNDAEFAKLLSGEG